jgi:DNA topoisomerase VI subunit A
VKKIYQKLYVLQNHEIRKNTNFRNFLFVGKNWDYYFTEKNSKNANVLENVVLTLKFQKEKFIDRDFDNS